MLSKRTVARLRDIIEDTRRVASFIDGMTLYTFIADERTIFAIAREEVPAIGAAAELALGTQ